AALRDAGASLTLGSDSNAVIDVFEEMRAVELDERLVSGRRGTWAPAELLEAATLHGQRSLGFGEVATADEVLVNAHSVRLAGTGATPEAAVFAASASDVDSVVVGGEPVVRDGQHLRVDDVAGELESAVTAWW